MPGRQEHIEATLVCDVAENESTQSGPWTMSFGKKIFFNIFIYFFAIPCTLWDLSSLTRDGIQSLGRESRES